MVTAIRTNAPTADYEHEQMNREIPDGRRSRRRARFIAATASAQRSEARFNPSARQLLSRFFRKSSLSAQERKVEA